MPPRKVSGRGIVKSGNAGNSSKSSPLVSEGSKSNTNTDKEKPLFPPGSKYPLSLLTERYPTLHHMRNRLGFTAYFQVSKEWLGKTRSDSSEYWDTPGGQCEC